VSEEVEYKPVPPKPYAWLNYYRKTDADGKVIDYKINLECGPEARLKGEEHAKVLASEIVILSAVIVCAQHTAGFMAGVDEFCEELKSIYTRAQEDYEKEKAASESAKPE
jgi:hypothetical protein